MVLTLITGTLVAVAAIAAWGDLRTRRIPNTLTYSALVIALVLRALLGPEALLSGLAGAGLALGLGFLLFALRAFGGGDGKLMMAMGAFLGLEHLLMAFVLMGLAGGVLAAIEIARRRAAVATFLNLYLLMKDRSTAPSLARPTAGALTVPYGVAIAFGAMGAWFLG